MSNPYREAADADLEKWAKNNPPKTSEEAALDYARALKDHAMAMAALNKAQTTLSNAYNFMEAAKRELDAAILREIT